VLVGVGALALMLWEPHLEGRNAHATVLQIYFNDPFLAYAYIASIAFFTMLYRGFKLLGHAGRNEALSERSLKALRSIRNCALVLVASLMGAEAYFFMVQRSKDDIAGGVMIGLALIVLFAVVATAAALLERTLHSAVAAKSEHETTASREAHGHRE
jgi:hypothetical protein